MTEFQAELPCMESQGWHFQVCLTYLFWTEGNKPPKLTLRHALEVVEPQHRWSCVSWILLPEDLPSPLDLETREKHTGCPVEPLHAWPVCNHSIAQATPTILKLVLRLVLPYRKLKHDIGQWVKEILETRGELCFAGAKYLTNCHWITVKGIGVNLHGKCYTWSVSSEPLI